MKRKRDKMETPNKTKKITTTALLAALALIFSYIAVSYTHLDVYKRQSRR